MSKVLITGGTGLIGSRLSGLLKAKGYEVIILTRNNNFKSSHDSFHWNIEEYRLDDSAFKNIDHILHLAGAGVADKRWSTKRKKEILHFKSINILCLSVLVFVCLYPINVNTAEPPPLQFLAISFSTLLP